VPRDKLKVGGQTAAETAKNGKSPMVPIPRTEVCFRSEREFKSVVVDDDGHYTIDLPLGLYEMTAIGPGIGKQELTHYIRVFEVLVNKTVVLNGALYIARSSCDTVETRPERLKDACGGVDSFSIKTNTGKPLVLYIEYPRREYSGQGITYRTDKFGWPGVPVVLSYNLLSIQANRIDYFPKANVIEATDVVALSNGTADNHRESSMRFHIEGGEAVQVN